MALLVLLEARLAFREPPTGIRGRRGANIRLFALVLVAYSSLTIVVSAAAANRSAIGPSLFTRLGAEGLAGVALAIVALDFFSYAAHRLMHAAPFLWRFHQVHHSDAFVDATTAFRQHPIESLWRFALTYAPALALGVPAEAVALYRGLSGVFALAEHANLALPARADALLSLVFVTPRTHKVHHSRRPAEADSNFANIFSFYVRVFLTFTRGDGAATVAYGLDSVPTGASAFAELLISPFERPAAIASRPAGTWKDTS
jgi:sterol desaturase/sphingolipid hydroxylase (fatty acid hydroxylase superfamily)